MPYTFKHGDRPLDGLTIQRAIGRGGFGEVYYALTDSGKQVALKYLRDNPEVELRGISHVMNLKSPHLITIYDVRQDSAGEPFVIMEYVSGPSLRELMLAEPHGLGPQKAAFFIDGVAKGLAYLHERGIVHRDLKPANIFYDDGYVKIGDYGLSKHISVSQHSGQTVSVGTVHYMAPEIGSGSYTKAIDIYAIGVILFELLTGRLPFTGSSMGEILMRHLSERPDLTGIPDPFARVIAQALAKDPKDRFQDANEMMDALRGFADVTASLASFDPSTLSRMPRHPEAADPERTLTTPPRVPPPPLDVHGAPPPRGEPESLADRLERKADAVARKLEKKAEKVARKLEKGAEKLRRFGIDWPSAATPAGRAAAPGAPPRTHRWGQLFVLLAVAVAVAIGLTALQSGPEEMGVALAFALLAGTFGPLLAYFKFLSRWPARGPLWDRLTYAGITALLMIPAFAIATDAKDNNFPRVMAAPLAALVICDWTRRIETGRRGEVRGRQAFTPALVGLIAAALADADRYEFVAASVCATMSLLVQAGASLWPATRVAAPTPDGPPIVPVASPLASSARVAPPPAPTPSQATRYVAQTPAGGADLVPRTATSRTMFGVLSTLALAACLGSFFALAIGQPDEADVRAGLLFVTLAGLAWLPFLVTKAFQKYHRPRWRGTLRMLIFSAGLTLTAGTISAIASGGLTPDDLTAAIFMLVVGLVVALVVLFVTGSARPAAAGAVSGSAAASVTVAPDSQPAAHGLVAAPTPPELHPATAEPPPAPLVIDAAAPSFVGRAANAGLSFVGKLLLLATIVLALGHHVLREQTQKVFEHSSVQVPPAASVFLQTKPGPALLALGAAGSALLLLARRTDGASHLTRGCLGCALGLWAVLHAVGPAASAWRELLTTGDWSTLPWARLAGPLVSTAVPLTVAFLLLAWPKRSRERTIVI